MSKRGERYFDEVNAQKPAKDSGNLPTLTAYKESEWAEEINVCLRFLTRSRMFNDGQLPNHARILDEWTKWMIEGGFQLPREQVEAKLVELRHQFNLNNANDRPDQTTKDLA